MISIPSDEGRGSANASPACSLAITERGAKSVGESTPLLKERSGGSVQVFAPDSPPLDLSLRGEIQQWFIQSLPVVVATTCRVGLSVIDTGFLGHLSTEALAAASIASTIMFIMMNGISGAAACINALGAQCYGAGNKKLVGVWLQISVVVCSVAAVPAIVLFMFIDPMLAPIIPEAEVRQLAGEFARWSSLSIWPAAMYVTPRRDLCLIPATSSPRLPL